MSVRILDPTWEWSPAKRTTAEALVRRLRKDQEPRLSQAQREAILAAAQTDPRAVVDGLDKKHRPVVRAKLGGPNGTVRYALLKDGTSTPIILPLAETWR